MHKSFSQAVAGIEASLEVEKIHSARMLSALDNLPVGVALLDLQGRIQYGNQALWQLYAIDYSDIPDFMGKSWLKLHTDRGQEQIREHVQPILEKHNIWHGETDLMRQDGVLIRASMYISKNSEGYIGFVRDITETANAKQEMDKLQTQIHMAQKTDAVERVLRALIHEFNNGLSSVIGFSEILSEDLEEKSSARSYADRIWHTGHQMHGLIEQARLLLPSKKTDDKDVANYIKIIPAVIGEVKRTIPDQFTVVQNINITEAEVACDSFRLGQAIHHLIENAAEAGGENREIKIDISYYIPDSLPLVFSAEKLTQFHEKINSSHVRLHYGLYDPAVKYIWLRIEDKGKGIPFDIIDNILDPYFTSKKEKKKGSGLGMAIVRSVARQYQGYLLIDSIVDSGTVVSLLLPEAPLMPDGFPATKEEERQPTPLAS